MDSNKPEQLEYFTRITSLLNLYSNSEIEDAIMYYCLYYYGYENNEYKSSNSQKIKLILDENNFSTNLENVVEYFESLLGSSNKEENGIVFTPKYIADFINEKTVNLFDNEVSIIDPGCGCGIFLVSVAELLLKKTHLSINQILENNIYGIDIDPDNVRRCKLVLKLLCAFYKGSLENFKCNIMCKDSLKEDWNLLFHKKNFSYIVGNPPYVNPHDMKKETVEFLKLNFKTTKTGVFNIFYAFIEHGMKFLSEKGELGFIIPNNFFSIKSALDLRVFIQENSLLSLLIDFSDNMVFKPIRTYNCIMLLNKKAKRKFNYYVMPKVLNIQEILYNCTYQSMFISELDKNSWNLVDETTRFNLKQIESFPTSIKNFIRTGIATLKDEVYFVNRDDEGYYKIIDNKKFYIESDLVKDIYKIPELKTATELESVKRYIIFPYIKENDGYSLISEINFKTNYPKTYKCLESFKSILNLRDKGKGIPQGWFAYGRTQGLNKYGKKLLFPTFSNIPKFIYVDNEDALFCNGYAVFDNDFMQLKILQKILNSKIMEFYVRNTSYSIEGGYYCYQKKYVENFSIPNFNKEEILFISSAQKDELDSFLWNYYKLR